MNFNLDQAIAEWKRQLHKQGSFEEGDLEELEDHLRTGVEEKVAQGMTEEAAFEHIIREQYSRPREISQQYTHQRTSQAFYPALLVNYVKVGLRAFTRQPLYYFINLIGLVVGLASVFCIALYLDYESGYDRMHHHGDQIYRLNIHYERSSGSVNYPLIPPAAGPTFSDHFPQVEQSARIRYAYSVQMHKAERSFYEDKVFFAEPAFLEMFSFQWLTGKEKDALSEVNTVVLTKDMAEKYFGNENPIGEAITYNNETELRVVGVMENPPPQSHLDFDFLVSFDTFQPGPGSLEPLTSWKWLGFLTYLKLTPETDRADLIAGMNALSEEINGPRPGVTSTYGLQQLYDIYLHSGGLSNPMGGLFRVNDPDNLKSLATIGLLIVMIAFFNYYNISTALVRIRTREMGIRKVFGASKARMIQQIGVESFTILSMAAAISFLFIFMGSAYMVLPDGMINQSVLMKLLVGAISIMVIFTLGSGFLLGGTLSAFSAMSLLQNQLGVSRQRFSMNNLVLVLQFGISAAMIMISLIVVDQLAFFSKKELGYDPSGVLVAKYRGEEMQARRETFKQTLEQLPDVTAVTFGPALDGSTSGSPLRLREWQEEQNIQTAYFGVDYQFDKIMQLEMLEGRYFSKAHAQDSVTSILVNETLADQLGREGILGKKVAFTREEYEIIGVFKDFHYKSLHYEIGPMALKMWLGPPRNVLIRYNTTDIAYTLGKIEQGWSTVFADGAFPFEYRLLDEQLAAMYDKEKEYANLLKLFTALAIFVALIGLFGLSSINVDQNIKQIGIRRVLGAELSQIANVVSRKFLIIVMIGAVAAVPLVFLVMGEWLSNFAYSINLGIRYPAITLIIVLVMTSGTLAYQVFRVMTVNPSKILRDD